MIQIKLGFDRLPTPEVRTVQPLYDIVRGVPLRDSNNNPLVTDTMVPLPELAIARKSTPIVLVSGQTADPVEMIEQFPEFSQVSSTLLGVPRAETQLSLFSDVSTYGLNPEEFEFYRFNSLQRPTSWYTRFNETYGNHYAARLREAVKEQALSIEAYPVNYRFARGPRYENYDPVAYERFVRFVLLGNQFYEDYKEDYPQFASDHFLNPEDVTVQDMEVDYQKDDADSFAAIEKWTLAWMDIRDGLLDDPRSPGNAIVFPEGFGSDEAIPGGGSGGRYYGILQSKKAYRYQPGRISGFTFGFRCSTDEASSSNIIEWGIGNDTDQYIFQVRGAQFSLVRRSTIALPESVLVQQGLSASDQRLVTSPDPLTSTQMYEVVIPRDRFNGDTVDGNGRSGYLIDPRKVTMYKVEFGWYGAVGAKFYAYVPAEYGEARWVLMHTLVIENAIGEPCLADPNFKFRYSLDIQDTTSLRFPQYLYKYGASCFIDGGDQKSAKFYSFLSEDNIVNSSSFSPILGLLPKDSLSNAEGYEKANKNNTFPSSLTASTDQLTEIKVVEVEGGPDFGHHYSPSIHATQSGINRGIQVIEGGTAIEVVDDDPIDVAAITSASPAVVTTAVPHVFFTGQRAFITSVVGMTEINDTSYYIEVIDDTSFALYTDSVLETPVNSTTYTAYDSGGVVTGTPIFLESQDDSKLINTGLFSVYLQYRNETVADVARIGTPEAYTKQKNASLPPEVNVGGVQSLDDIDLSDVRFTNYDALATSSVGLTGDVIDVNFLNPVVRESTRQTCDFLIGVTDQEPVVVQEEDAAGNLVDRIKFRAKDGEELFEPSLDNLLYEEFTNEGISRDRDGYETGEHFYGTGVKMDIDYRIPNPPGVDSGRCSSVRFAVEERLGFSVEYSAVNPDTGEFGEFLVFNSRPTQLLDTDLIGGELGIGESSLSSVASGIKFTSDVVDYVADPLTEELGYYVSIDLAPDDPSFTLWVSPVTVSDRNNLNINSRKKFFRRRIFSYEAKPLYLVVRLRDNARVNNVTVTEYFPDGKSAFSPDWITNQQAQFVSSGGSQSDVPAENFVSDDRLASTSVTTGLTQPLRPYKVRDTLYISPNENFQATLERIYGPDRTTLSPGYLNTTATYFIGKSLEDSSLNLVNFGVIVKE